MLDAQVKYEVQINCWHRRTGGLRGGHGSIDVHTQDPIADPQWALGLPATRSDSTVYASLKPLLG